MISVHKCETWKNFVLAMAVAGSMGAFSATAQDNSQANVQAAQEQLKNAGYYSGPVDGVDGAMTKAAIRKYQSDNNLTANGRLDRRTCDRLGLQGREPTGTNEEANSSQNNITPVPTSATVSAAQRSLAKKGFYKGIIDGEDGPETQAAIREYQKNSNLNVTSRLDQATLSSLGVSK